MWTLISVLSCFCTKLAIVVAKSQDSCSISLPNDVKGFAPVILTSNTGSHEYRLFKPTGQVTNLKDGSQLLLACSGKKNVFENKNYDTLQLECSKGSFVDLNNNVQLLKELVCKSIPTSSMKITTNECSHGNGYIYEIGFIIQGEFYGPVFEICYSNVTENTFYTHSTINGAAINSSIPESTRRSFTADGMRFNTNKANILYKKSNQIERFNKYFGRNQNYLDEKNFLARGHLAADADFIFAYEQLSTYYYANAAPEFQIINAGNWLRVEELARAVSSSYKDDVESYTSYMGILSLPKTDGDLVDIYLDDKKLIEVPKYYYKILLHRASDSAIVFVTVNNPYIKNGPIEQICKDVCRKSGLEHKHFPDVRKGYTFCCELNEFKLFANLLPDKVGANNLLRRKR